MVEFAVALPIFVLLLLAIFDFGRLLFTYISLADATREMARTAAVSRSTDSAVIAAFNNFVLFTSSTNPATDRVQLTVADQSCINDLRQGSACSPDSIASATCPLPLQPGCTLPPRSSSGGGYIQVDVTYSFTFNPLFQASLEGVQVMAFERPLSVLTTSEQAYLE
jgi:Flp pilus assembly protein TadG